MGEEEEGEEMKAALAALSLSDTLRTGAALIYSLFPFHLITVAAILLFSSLSLMLTYTFLQSIHTFTHVCAHGHR